MGLKQSFIIEEEVTGIEVYNEATVTVVFSCRLLHCDECESCTNATCESRWRIIAAFGKRYDKSKLHSGFSLHHDLRYVQQRFLNALPNRVELDRLGFD
jgi:hypothetical protein